MDTEANWDKMSNAYEDFTSGEDSYSATIEMPCIEGMLPSLAGKRVIDLGCGTGRFTFWLESLKPGRIMGVDLSEGMLALARRKAAETGSSALFIKADASERFTDEKFDFVFSSTLTHYIHDLDAFFGYVSDMLAPNGQCVFSVMNPVYTAQYPIARGERFPDDDEWTVRYLDRRERTYIQPWIEYNDDIEDFLSHSYHHTFSDYANAVARAGMVITEAREPLPPEGWKARYPERYASFIETPTYLVFSAVKL